MPTWTKEVVNLSVAGTSLTIDDIIINDTNIGHTDDTDLLALANGALTLNGTLTANGAVTVGVNDTGYDVKFFGPTSGNYLLYNGAASGDSDDDQLVVVCSAAAKGISIRSTNTTSTGGPVLQLFRQSASSAADADEIGTIKFDGYDESGTSYQEYANITGQIVDATGGSEEGALHLKIMTTGGSMITGLKCIGTTTSGQVDSYFPGGNVIVGASGDGADIQFFGAIASNYMLWDASADRLEIRNSYANNGLVLSNTNADAINSPAVAYYRNSASAAAADVLGITTYWGRSIGGASADARSPHTDYDDVIYARLQSSIVDPTDGGEEGAFKIGVMANGTFQQDSLTLTGQSDGTVDVNIGLGAASTTTIIGDLTVNTAGTSNAVFGVAAGDSIASGGNYNSLFGDSAGTAITTGDENTLIGKDCASQATDIDRMTMVGYRAGYLITSNTDADQATAFGYAAQYSLTEGQNNTSLGYASGYKCTTGDSNTNVGSVAGYWNATGNYNTFVGRYAGYGSDGEDMGDSNTALGHKAGYKLESEATGNTLIGATAADALTTGTGNVAIGKDTLNVATSASANVIIGQAAGNAITTANNHIFIGNSVGYTMTTGTGNTAIGYYAFKSVTTNSGASAGLPQGNTALGYKALEDMNTTDASAGYGYNTALGYQAALNLTTGEHNIAVGAQAMGTGAVTGDRNIAIGYKALEKNVDGDYNIAIGYEALEEFEATSAGDGDNIAIGSIALSNCTTGQGNVGIGHAVAGGVNNLIGDQNVCIGYASGYDMTAGTGNTFLGASSGGNNTDGLYNVGVGKSALVTNQDGDKNTAIGYAALYTFEADADGHGGNTALGFNSGYYMSTGTENTFIGMEAGKGITGTRLEGNANTALGYRSGFLLQGDATQNVMLGYQAGNALTTGSNNICIGFDSDCSAVDSGDQIVIGKDTTGIGDNYAVIGPAALTRLYVAADGAGVLYADGTINTSDERTKENINEMSLGLDFINALNPVEFEKRQPKDYDEDLKSKILEQRNGLRDIDKSEKEKIRSGLLAQNVSSVLEEYGYSSNNDIVKIDEQTTKQQLDYAKFVAPLVKAIQELSAKVNKLENKE